MSYVHVHVYTYKPYMYIKCMYVYIQICTWRLFYNILQLSTCVYHAYLRIHVHLHVYMFIRTCLYIFATPMYTCNFACTYTKCLPADGNGVQHTSTAVTGSGGTHLCSICMDIQTYVYTCTCTIHVLHRYGFRTSVDFIVQTINNPMNTERAKY